MPKEKTAKKTSGAAPRKMSPYNLYMKRELPKYKAANPDVAHKEAFKAVAGMWKNSPDNPKK
ncbi:hypothetical protein H4R33_004811 [Dimargaris cristalligena]|uniref:HMG box domain-containing protein n=1 Tax=Dimargaris cristalligena TaxID=215637 RepID=A0A4P9ZUW5_9FUNG|nr:hypothetical protein H4R33_004811 [Dimargaris cristalligena]RKP37355.1 hypothetical protein BJ085DRAFT_24791 [Dimargaris cristalligena]|eukprot:RKP37355.1 hypothetical protein BJ085DRAFT_24791 [Dimargaris cristalligena]